MVSDVSINNDLYKEKQIFLLSRNVPQESYSPTPALVAEAWLHYTRKQCVLILLRGKQKWEACVIVTNGGSVEKYYIYNVLNMTILEAMKCVVVAIPWERETWYIPYITYMGMKTNIMCQCNNKQVCMLNKHYTNEMPSAKHSNVCVRQVNGQWTTLTSYYDKWLTIKWNAILRAFS